MPVKFYSEVDMRSQAIRRMVIDPVNTFPTTGLVNGRVVFRSDLGQFYWYRSSSSSWLPFGSVGIIAGAGTGLSLTPQPDGSVQISFNPDATFLRVDATSNEVTIVDGSISSTQIADGAVTATKIPNTTITLNKLANITSMILLGRTSSGTGTVEQIPIINDGTLASAAANNLATAAAIKTYVDNHSGGGSSAGYQGQWNAATAGGNFPQMPSGNIVGAYWDISVPGTIQGSIYQVGDVIQVRVANASPSNAADWIKYQGNLDQATETLAGYARIATQAETNLGSDDTTIVTPKKLLASLLARDKRYATTVGDGSTTSFLVNHNLSTTTVAVLILDLTWNQEIINAYTVIDLNNIQFDFVAPPTANQYSIIVKAF